MIVFCLGLVFSQKQVQAQVCPTAFWEYSLEEFQECSQNAQHSFTIVAPVVCKDNDNLAVDKVYVFSAKGPAIVASGNCNIVIRDSHIEGTNGLVITDKARVSIYNSVISSRFNSVVLNNLSTLSTTSTLFRGKVERKDWATFRDNGGNKYFD